MIASLSLAGFTTVLLWLGRRRLAGLTLMATWYWTLAAVWGLSLAEAFVSASTESAAWSQPLRFAAAMLGFCPVISYMGAKRPQDGAWNFIVFSLWVVLALPAAETYFMAAGQSLEIHDLRAWFLWALIFLSISNLLPTKFWGSALLIGAAEVLLLGEHLPLVRSPLGEFRHTIALAAIAAAIAWALLSTRREPIFDASIDRAWLDFRDTFGTLWSLRVLERINNAAETQDWPVALTWFGFRRMATGEPIGVEPLEEDELPEEIEQAIRQTMRNLLRRFVSEAWLAERWGEEQSAISPNRPR